MLKILKNYNTTGERKVLIMFDEMETDMDSNKKIKLIITEFFIRDRKLNISLNFTSQFYFMASKNIRLNATHYFIMKIPNKRELQQIVVNYSSDTEFKFFSKIYKDYTKEPTFIFIERYNFTIR